MNRVGLLIIGDEILSGRVHDSHTPFLARRLATRGMDVCEVRVVGDKKEGIAKAVRELRNAYSWVFTTGGVGSTHDDVTIAAVAEAVDRPLVEHPVVMQAIVDHFPRSLQTFHPFGHGCIPQGAELIPNPVSFIPSFCIDKIYVLPGMPDVMHGMMDALLPMLPQWPVIHSISVQCTSSETFLAQSLHDLQERYPNVSIGSYPYMIGTDAYGTVLVARSRDEMAMEQVGQALNELVELRS